MTSGQDIIRSVSRTAGFELEHVEQVAGSLAQSGAWPADRAKAITLLLLALLAEAEPKSAASVATQYYDLAAFGQYPSAGLMLQNMMQNFLDQTRTQFWNVSCQSSFEVYSNVAAIKLHVPCVNRSAEVLFVEEHDPNAWHDRSTRHSNVISGKTLFYIADDLLKADPAHV